jgi:hypothetical protein
LILQSVRSVGCSLRFVLKNDDHEIADAVLFILDNGVSKFGFLEISVMPEFRGDEEILKLIKVIVDQAKAMDCTEIITRVPYIRNYLHRLFENSRFIDFGQSFSLKIE